MNNQDRKIWGVYALLIAMVIAVVGVLVFLFAHGPRNLSESQIEAYVRTVPEDCRPLVQARLRKRLVDEGRPLRVSDIQAPMREIDIDDCRAISEQLRVLDPVPVITIEP